MLIEFDQNTLANMTAALESVCKKLPADKDNHDNRKSIADAMIASARIGKRSYLDLKDAGAVQPSKSGWLGLKDFLSLGRDGRARSLFGATCSRTFFPDATREHGSPRLHMSKYPM